MLSVTSQVPLGWELVCPCGKCPYYVTIWGSCQTQDCLLGLYPKSPQTRFPEGGSVKFLGTNWIHGFCKLVRMCKRASFFLFLLFFWLVFRHHLEIEVALSRASRRVECNCAFTHLPTVLPFLRQSEISPITHPQVSRTTAQDT